MVSGQPVNALLKPVAVLIFTSLPKPEWYHRVFWYLGWPQMS